MYKSQIAILHFASSSTAFCYNNYSCCARVLDSDVDIDCLLWAANHSKPNAHQRLDWELLASLCHSSTSEHLKKTFAWRLGLLIQTSMILPLKTKHGRGAMKPSGPARMRDCRKYFGNVWRFKDFYKSYHEELKKEFTSTSARCNWPRFFLPALVPVTMSTPAARLACSMPQWNLSTSCLTNVSVCRWSHDKAWSNDFLCFYCRFDFVSFWQLHLSKPVCPGVHGQAPSFAPVDCRSRKAWDQLHLLHDHDMPQPMLFEANKQRNKQTNN